MKYTVKQLSIILNVSEEQIRRWIRGGKLNATLHSKKEGYVIERDDFNAFLDGAGSKYKTILQTKQLSDSFAKTHKSIAIFTTLERLFKLRRQLASIQQEIDNELTYLHNLLEKDS